MLQRLAAGAVGHINGLGWQRCCGCSSVSRDGGPLPLGSNNRPLAVLTSKRGHDVIHDPMLNKSTAHDDSERDRLGIRGLLPPRKRSLQDQADKLLQALNSELDPIKKWIFLTSLQDRNETLFYKMVKDNLALISPIVYTPTVGLACQNYSTLLRRPRGMFFSAADRGQMRAMVQNWNSDRVDVVVVTDGSRILGLGDLGCQGMGIPIGKLVLYVAAAGIHPAHTLPCIIDVGTNNEAMLQNPHYLGLSQKRITGDAYFAIIDEFVQAVHDRWPQALIQFEDFAHPNADILLKKYRHKYLCFNDDIQGTGAMVLAGVISSLRLLKRPAADLTRSRIVCVGAGTAGLGVCEALLMGMTQCGISEAEGLKNFFVLDNLGLLTKDRAGLTAQQQRFATDRDGLACGMDLTQVVDIVKPHILLGLCGVPNVFTESALRSMARHVAQPFVFALSNPTSRCECTATQAYQWTDGRCVFASGSPFDPVTLNGITHRPNQGNNMFIFPGVGLGATMCRPRHITDSMFYQAAVTCAETLSEAELAAGQIFPNVSCIREVSLKIAKRICEVAKQEGLATVALPSGDALQAHIASQMYEPEYVPLLWKPT
eukprot:gnl/Hemi2/23897_TR8021_c0_g1_i1.p1 gnl/Hemi2/23897_TR8021_c0_g1~~gnl/Hemi2/23897_TR8021_c0_g1_i1.p1  ORF type:complete len:622 (-),score=214.87 gnl/Hemi2/23897_TR8021_c0_g1_i1:191-1987(-)